MNRYNKKFDTSTLHAYVDGQLNEAELQQVEAFLLINPEAAVIVDSIRQQNKLLHSHFDSVLDEKIPKSLLAATREKKHITRLYRIAAAISLFLLGGVMGFTLNNTKQNNIALTTGLNRFVQQATLAHAVYTPEIRHPVEVDAKHEKHLVAWLTKRLGTPINVPQLTSHGFTLVGGRLLPGDNGPSAQFMYEDSQKQRLTLYIQKNTGAHETAFLYTNQHGVSSFYWVDTPLIYALNANVNRRRLLSIAHLVYEDLNPSTDSTM